MEVPEIRPLLRHQFGEYGYFGSRE